MEVGDIDESEDWMESIFGEEVEVGGRACEVLQ